MSTGIPKRIVKITYKCPSCKILHTYDEWTTKDVSIIEKLLCRGCDLKSRPLSLTTILPQPWVELSNKLIDPARMDPQNEIKAQDKIEEVKKKELRTNAKAARWEQGRKAEWKANKPYYLKQFKHGG